MRKLASLGLSFILFVLHTSPAYGGNVILEDRTSSVRNNTYRNPETGRLQPSIDFSGRHGVSPGHPGYGRDAGTGGGAPGGGAGERAGSPFGGYRPGFGMGDRGAGPSEGAGGNGPGVAGRSNRNANQGRAEGAPRRTGRQGRGDGDAYVGIEADIQGGSDLQSRFHEDRLGQAIQRVARGYSPFVVRFWEEGKQRAPNKQIHPNDLRRSGNPFHVPEGESDEDALVRSGLNQPLLPFFTDEEYWQFAWRSGHRDPLTSGESRLGFGHSMWAQWERETRHYQESNGIIRTGTQNIQNVLGPEINQEFADLDRLLNSSTPNLVPQNTQHESRFGSQGSVVSRPAIACPMPLGLEFCSSAFSPSENDLEISRQIKRAHESLVANRPISPQQRAAQESAFSLLYASNEALKERAIFDSRVALELGKLLAEIALGIPVVTSMAQDAYALFLGRNFVSGEEVTTFEKVIAGASLFATLFTRGAHYPIRNAIESTMKILTKHSDLFRVNASTIRMSDDVLRNLEHADFSPRQIVDAIKEVHVKGMDFILGIPNLRRLPNGDWLSGAGLVYGPDRIHGNRLLHVLEHAVPNPSKGVHSIFNVPVREIPQLVDDAWLKRGLPTRIQPDGNKVYIVDMQRPIGSLGERQIRLVVKGGSENHIVTAHPWIPDQL